MTLEGLLTLASLLLAIYAIVPRSRKLAIHFRVGVLQWFLLIAAFVSVVAFNFNDLLARLGLDLLGAIDHWSLGVERLSFLSCLTFLLLLILSLRLPSKHIAPRRIAKLCELGSSLLWSQEYEDLAQLVRQYGTAVIALSKEATLLLRWKNRLAGWGDRSIASRLISIGDVVDGRAAFHVPWWHTPMRWATATMARLIPERAKAVRAAEEFLAQTLTHHGFVSYTSLRYPYVGVDLIQQDFGAREEFLRIYIRELLEHTESRLFYEVRANESFNREGRYYIDESSRILHELFGTSVLSEKLHIWKPVGDFMLEKLDDNALHGKIVDPYNGPVHTYNDHGRLRCPLWVSIRVFDIMVTEAHFSEVEYNMWLQYLTIATQKICTNFVVTDQARRSPKEWPNKYGYLLYETFTVFDKWTRLNPVVDGQSSAEQPKLHIPVPASHAEVQSLKYVLNTPAIPQDFKMYLGDMVIQTYLDLVISTAPNRLIDSMRTELTTCSEWESDDPRGYYKALLRLIDGVDHFKWPRGIVSDVRDAVAAKLAQPGRASDSPAE